MSTAMIEATAYCDGVTVPDFNTDGAVLVNVPERISHLSANGLRNLSVPADLTTMDVRDLAVLVSDHYDCDNCIMSGFSFGDTLVYEVTPETVSVRFFDDQWWACHGEWSTMLTVSREALATMARLVPAYYKGLTDEEFCGRTDWKTGAWLDEPTTEGGDPGFNR